MEDKLKYLIDQFNNTLKVKSEEFVLNYKFFTSFRKTIKTFIFNYIDFTIKIFIIYNLLFIL